MKKILLLVCIGVTTLTHAQFIEFGGGPGITNYSGDLVRGFNLNTSSIAGTVYYRMNFSEIVTLRLGLTLGSVKGSETPIDAFAIERNHSFNNSILEVSSVFEYHFLDYKSEGSSVDWSPYIFAGFGVANFNNVPANTGKLQSVIPMGVGFKHLFRKKFCIGFEAGARKTFFDQLDGISDGDITIKDYQYGNPKDDDWYFFTGISFSIILFNVPCPFPYVPNGSLFSR